ncbi:glycosyltransferase [Lysobacter antibioticus]|nr:glycosyltransferase [Lysobacter antibioticus]
MSIRIHQFHSGSAYGDAVTNSMLLMREHLHALGFASEIFAEHLDPALGGAIRPYHELAASLSPQDLLIVRHSMGHDQLENLLALNCRKVLMYHNITPAGFFDTGSVFHRYSLLGREQLSVLKGAVEHAFADSRYNASELQALGFGEVDVLPVLVRDEKYAKAREPRCLESGLGRPWTVLFVGRICENKGHGDLIAVAEHWLKRHPAHPIKFVCVGGYSVDDPFYIGLRRRLDAAGLGTVVQFLGKVPDEELLDWYTRADCYLSLSRHEGFGVPIIEAMLCDLPVIALQEAAVAETMGGAGLGLADTAPAAVCAQLFRLMRNRPLRRHIVEGQRQRALAFRSQAIRGDIIAALDRLSIAIPRRNHASATEPVGPDGSIRFEGPCESSYSLASVNRELAKALSARGERVRLFCTEGPGDYVPDAGAVKQLDATTRELMQVSADAGKPSVVVRNLYPPRVRDARGELNSGYFFWEESAFPDQYVADFNLSLDSLLAPSRFVASTLRSSGVNLPIRFVGTGADHILDVEPEALPVKLTEGFRFLHVSSGFPRKGADILLEAWATAFAGRRDVCLIIKTFPNVHNDIPQRVEELKRSRPGFPPVQVLMEDYTPGQIRSLYQACHAYVAPSRGEGFGLPMAEAMLHRIPVIATGWGGHVDFCNEDTSYPIRYRLVRSSSHLAGQEAPLWAEPDATHLAELMQRVKADPDGEVAQRVESAHRLISAEYSWERVAQRCEDAFAELKGMERDFSAQPLRLAWISTWNEACGIAAYSRYLLDHVDESEVKVSVYGRHNTSVPDGKTRLTPAWKDCSESSLRGLVDAVLRDGNETAVIQFNFGFFNVQALAEAVSLLDEAGVSVVLMLHSTRDVDKPDFKASLRTGLEGLKRAARILVHSEEDLNRLIEFGLGERAAIFHHGVMDVAGRGQLAARDALEVDPAVKIVASYGFMLPHKGLIEVVEAFAELCKARDDVYLFMVNALYPDASSTQLHHELLARMDSLGIRSKVRMFTDFLPEEVGLCLLEAADLIVFPYQNTAESSSAAVRFGIATRRPVATTSLGIFSDIEGQGLRFRGREARDIAADLKQWFSDDSLERSMHGRDAWIGARSWPRLMLKMTNLLRGLVIDAASPDPARYTRNFNKD